MLASLRVSELSEDGLAWYVRYLTALTSGDPTRLAPLLDEACEFQLNNVLPIHGRDVIALGIATYLTGVESLQPQILNIYGSDRAFAAELLHHYVRKDGAQITVPAAGFVTRNEAGLVTSARAHFDATPVFADTLRV